MFLLYDRAEPVNSFNYSHCIQCCKFSGFIPELLNIAVGFIYLVTGEIADFILRVVAYNPRKIVETFCFNLKTVRDIQHIYM